MKITINVNLNKITFPYQDYFEKARLYHLKHNIDITFKFTNINVTDYKSTEITLHNGFKQYIVTGSHLVSILDCKADMNMFVFNQEEWATPKGSKFPLLPNTPTGNCFPYLNKPFINIGIYKDNPIVDEAWIQIAHEIMHALVELAKCKDVMDTYRYNTNPDSPTGNFAEQWNLLQDFINKNNMPTYKYFKDKEIVGLKPELVVILDKMRGECGFPFKINSGFRTKEQNNKLKDAVTDSAHLTGEAVDISITDSTQRMKIISSAFLNGIKRVGLAPTFVHLDLNKTLPQGVIWLY